MSFRGASQWNNIINMDILLFMRMTETGWGSTALQWFTLPSHCVEFACFFLHLFILFVQMLLSTSDYVFLANFYPDCEINGSISGSTWCLLHINVTLESWSKWKKQKTSTVRVHKSVTSSELPALKNSVSKETCTKLNTTCHHDTNRKTQPPTRRSKWTRVWRKCHLAFFDSPHVRRHRKSSGDSPVSR